MKKYKAYINEFIDRHNGKNKEINHIETITVDSLEHLKVLLHAKYEMEHVKVKAKYGILVWPTTTEKTSSGTTYESTMRAYVTIETFENIDASKLI